MPFPTNIQWRGNAIIAASASFHTCRLIDPTEAGDTVFVVGEFGSASDVISSVVDDVGGTLANGAWVKDKVQADAGNGQTAVLMRRSNCPKGMTKVVINFSAATGFAAFHNLKSNMIAPGSPISGAAVGANPTGTSLAAGNITTGEADCFFIYYAAMTSVGTQTSPVRFSAPADTSDLQTMLWAPDSTGPTCAMYGLKKSVGTFNPTITSDRSWAASAVVACAYRTAAGVGSPALTTLGGRVKFWMNLNHSSWIAGAGLGNPQTVDLPCDPAEVTSVAFAWSDPNGIFSGAPASNTSSSPANSWQATTPKLYGPSWKIGWVYAVKGAFAKNGTLTLNFTTSPTTSTTMQTLIFGMVNVQRFDAVGEGNASPDIAVPTTQTSVLQTDLVVRDDHSLVLACVQEGQQTVSNIVLNPSKRAVSLGIDDPGIYEFADGVHDGGFGHATEVPAGTYDFDVSWVDYESGLHLDAYGVQVLSFGAVPPYEVPPRLMGQQIF